jgi:hypothetical protein
MLSFLITSFVVFFIGAAASIVIFLQYRKSLREAKNYERGLKVVPMYIHIPPSSEDL